MINRIKTWESLLQSGAALYMDPTMVDIALNEFAGSTTEDILKNERYVKRVQETCGEFLFFKDITFTFDILNSGEYRNRPLLYSFVINLVSKISSRVHSGNSGISPHLLKEFESIVIHQYQEYSYKFKPVSANGTIQTFVAFHYHFTFPKASNTIFDMLKISNRNISLDAPITHGHDQCSDTSMLDILDINNIAAVIDHSSIGTSFPFDIKESFEDAVIDVLKGDELNSKIFIMSISGMSGRAIAKKLSLSTSTICWKMKNISTQIHKQLKHTISAFFQFDKEVINNEVFVAGFDDNIRRYTVKTQTSESFKDLLLELENNASTPTA